MLLLLCATILIASPFLLVKATNEKPTPLQWNFNELSQDTIPCSSTYLLAYDEVLTNNCKQAPLINNSTLMFDGGTRQTWIFSWTWTKTPTKTCGTAGGINTGTLDTYNINVNQYNTSDCSYVTFFSFVPLFTCLFTVQ